jgi:hypothetical protein
MPDYSEILNEKKSHGSDPSEINWYWCAFATLIAVWRYWYVSIFHIEE